MFGALGKLPFSCHRNVPCNTRSLKRSLHTSCLRKVKSPESLVSGKSSLRRVKSPESLVSRKSSLRKVKSPESLVSEKIPAQSHMSPKSSAHVTVCETKTDENEKNTHYIEKSVIQNPHSTNFGLWRAFSWVLQTEGSLLVLLDAP